MVDIDKYENLPYRESNKHLWARHNRKRIYGRKENHKIGEYYPWKIARRIINNNIGKSFDMAFHYYCTLVPSYQQKYFLDELFNLKWEWRVDYYVDDNGNIQKLKKEKKSKLISIVSPDYEVKPFNKLTGLRIDDIFFKRFTHSGKKIYKVRQIPAYKYSWKYKYLELHEFNIEYKVIKGTIQYFKSKQDKEFKRIMAEKQKARKPKFKKQRKLEQLNKAIELIRAKDKERIKKEKKENLAKIIAKGFDPITSFRNM